MSYGVDILAVEIPETYEEALAVRDEVTDERDEELGTGDDLGIEEPSTEMRELHRRLTAAYPCICDDSDGPWSDGPLINNFGQHAATLGISFSRVEEVLPFVIATATEMGFWVLDPQDETVHLPGGATIRPAEPEVQVPSGKRWWQFWKSDEVAELRASSMLDEPEVEPEATAQVTVPEPEPIRVRVSAALVSRGFRRNGGDHRQDLDDDFSLWVGFDRIGLEKSISPSVGIRSERVHTTMLELMGVPPDAAGPTVADNVGYVLGENHRTWYAPANTHEIVATIFRALDRLRPFASLSDLPAAFDLPGAPSLHRLYALATIALLANDEARVRQYLAEGERQFCGQADEVCEQFRDFERRVHARLAQIDSK